jgi:oxygen-independent coproporphyrinogen-3 oxidase
LQSAGVEQYEISNFAKQGFESRHNLKYWTRQPYLGFGVDAHSMLRSRNCEDEAVRFSMPESLDEFVAGKSPTRTAVCERAALEECFFLGLRLTKGIRLVDIENRFGSEVVGPLNTILNELVALKLIAREADWVRLTTRGRMLSNEVFERFLQLQEASQPS